MEVDNREKRELSEPMLEELGPPAERQRSESSIEEIEIQSREFFINDRSANSEFSFPDNAIKTSRYNLLTFIPVNLFEQFLRVANFYFLVTVMLQLIPGVSPFPLWSIAAPLGFILFVTAVKQAYEDVFRHIEDRKTNNKVFYRVANGTLEQVRSKQVRVGDVLRLEKGEFFPADILLISTSNHDDTCYVNTAELDGETAPKPKRAANLGLGTSLEEISELKGEVSAGPPVAQFDGFQGKLTLATEGKEGEAVPLSDDQLCLRGSKVDNSQFVYGLVYATGPDTKLMLNRLAVSYKFSSFENLLNKAVMCCLFLQLSVNALFAIVNTYSTTFDSLERSNVQNGFLEFITSFILFSYLIPLSLYVTLEFVRVGQGVGIGQDDKLSIIDWEVVSHLEDAEDDSPEVRAALQRKLSRALSVDNVQVDAEPPVKKIAIRKRCIVKTTDINDELGQVEIVFSDKTGTLTKNKMCLRSLFMDGVHVQNLFDGEEKEQSSLTELVDALYVHGEKSSFHSMFANESLSKNSKLENFEYFMLNLLLCNEIILTGKNSIEFQSLSPDEIAFVEALHENGITLSESSDRSKSISFLRGPDDKVTRTFQIHGMLKFSADRKRMTVVCEDDAGNYLLLSKGADSKMVTFVDESIPESKEMLTKTDEFLIRFANNGNRTLVFTSRPLSKEEFTEWKSSYDSAAVSLVNREGLIEKSFEKMEHSMTLLGCTAVEDPLQDGVPEAISKLVAAHIEVIVLTGDKKETAVAIGKQASIVRPESKLLMIEAQTPKKVLKELKACLETTLGQGPFAMIINGNSLEISIKEHPDVFLELLQKCQTIVCSRATPGQKAEIVNLVKKRLGKICLAIGDGANDVSMIQKANVGIGLTGKEGNQAAQASDFVLHRFRHLPRLLFVHGRYSYIRLTKVVLWSFYKNTFFPVPMFLYGFFSNFSDQPLYDALIMTCFNMFFTSLPPLIIGWTEKDVPEPILEKQPKAYQEFRDSAPFNLRVFAQWIFLGIFQGFIVYWLAFGVFYDVDIVQDDGKTVGIYTFGAWQCTALIIIINSTFLMNTANWTPAIMMACFLGVFAYLLGFGVYGWSISLSPDLYGIVNYLFLPPLSYLYQFVTIGMCLVPILIYNQYNRLFRPSSIQYLIDGQ